MKKSFLFLKLLEESFLFAVHALYVNKLRAFLSLLGISIGIFAIISVFTVVDSLESTVRGSVEALGNDVIYVQKWPWTFGPDYPWWKYLNRPLPAYSETDEIRKRSHTADVAAFMVSASGKTVKRQSNIVENANILGVSYDYYKVRSFELSQGRYFTEGEEKSGKNMALIGADIATNLFPKSDPVGQEIVALKRKIKVIGVFKREGESLIANSTDNDIMIPVNYARTIVDIRSERLNPTIMVKVKEGITNEQLTDELNGFMRSIRKLRPAEEENFALNEPSMLTSQLDSLFDLIGMAGWFIGGFSILVGGFGIANIMFVSVKERTNIIGIQKSLGAKNYFILLQFLFESVILSLFGGFVGLLVVYLAILVAGDVFDFTLKLSSNNIFLGLGVSGLIGVIAGFVPAFTASRMDPVEAIRTN